MNHKRRKLSSSAPHDRNSDDEPVAGPSYQPPAEPQNAPIFKLDTNCCDHIFDYLNERELQSVALTCKTMQQVTDDYFNRNFGSEFFLSVTVLYDYGYSMEKYNPLTYHLCIDEDFYNGNECLTKLIPKVRTVAMWVSDFHDSYNDYEPVFNDLHQFKRLEQLITHDKDFENNNWLTHTYPTLKMLNVVEPLDDFNIVIKFLKRNPSVEIFATCVDNIIDFHRQLFNVTLEILHVTLDGLEDLWPSGCSDIDKLHAKGCYKRLHLYIESINQPLIDRIAKLHGVERLIIKFTARRLHWPPFPDVKELEIRYASFAYGYSTEADKIVDALPNIQRVHLVGVHFDSMIPFIQRSPKLTRMKLSEVKSSPRVFQLQRWNKEREHLFGARKIIIYAPDGIFLETKWTTRNGDTDLNMIEMRRHEAWDWDPEHF